MDIKVVIIGGLAGALLLAGGLLLFNADTAPRLDTPRRARHNLSFTS